MAERCRFPAPGMQGGQAGAPGEVRIDGAHVDYRKNVVLEKGQRILLRTPGGGGMGPRTSAIRQQPSGTGGRSIWARFRRLPL